MLVASSSDTPDFLVICCRHPGEDVTKILRGNCSREILAYQQKRLCGRAYFVVQMFFLSLLELVIKTDLLSTFLTD